MQPSRKRKARSTYDVTDLDPGAALRKKRTFCEDAGLTYSELEALQQEEDHRE